MVCLKIVLALFVSRKSSYLQYIQYAIHASNNKQHPKCVFSSKKISRAHRKSHNYSLYNCQVKWVISCKSEAEKWLLFIFYFYVIIVINWSCSSRYTVRVFNYSTSPTISKQSCQCTSRSGTGLYFCCCKIPRDSFKVIIQTRIIICMNYWLR